MQTTFPVTPAITAAPSLHRAAQTPRGPSWPLAVGALACLVLPVSPAIGLLSGITLALTWGNPFENRAHRASQFLLKASVVGLGAGMNIGVVWRAGVQNLGYTAISIVATLSLGLWLGHRARLRPDQSLLVALGTAICGGSAIAAIAGVINPKRDDLNVAMITVFLLNAVALLIFPPIGHALGFSPEQFGLWAALAIHDTSSVVGAALAYDPASVSVATTVKLVRALWIVPVALGVGLWWPRPERKSHSTALQPLYRRLPVPGFILGFIAVATVFTLVPQLAPLSAPVTTVAHRCFAVTLFLMGSLFSRQALRHAGARPLIVGLILWIFVATATAIALTMGWLR